MAVRARDPAFGRRTRLDEGGIDVVHQPVGLRRDAASCGHRRGLRRVGARVTVAALSADLLADAEPEPAGSLVASGLAVAVRIANAEPQPAPGVVCVRRAGHAPTADSA